MNRPVRFIKRNFSKTTIVVLTLALLGLTSCAGKKINWDKTLEFGFDVLTAATQNFAPQYGNLMQGLFSTLKPIASASLSNSGEQEAEDYGG